MPGETAKGIAVLSSVVVAAAFTFATILENGSSEFTEVISGLGEPAVMGFGFLIIPISFYLLYKGPLS